LRRPPARNATGPTGPAPAPAASIVEVVWVDDAEMRAINRRYRGGSGTTDSLSFPDGGIEPGEETLRLGEVVVNLDLAERRARELGNTREAEAVLYAVHGLVHLLGGEDDTSAGRASMRAVETEALAAAGLRVKGGEWGPRRRRPP
jgi:probable rRNA maturation factor